ncbi:MAG: hypothetical protein A2Y17_06095 [Clostridiales bacterium GWF2_38_85]|nr:MAG: hypothetical protein A2Y17_06095 [Clostridiales bacterium GWF2_38_85]HBL85464.1 hypothetical protein [Clostridiales bacterium]
MSSGFRNFFITFVLALIVFGIGAYKIMPAVIDFIIPPETSETESEVSETSSEPNSQAESQTTSTNTSEPEVKGESFTSIILGKDLYGNIDAIMLIKVNKETKSYIISSIPADTMLQIDGANIRLRDLLKTRDISFYKDKITAITGLAVDYYAILDIEGLISMTDMLDGLYYNIPRDMFYEDPEQDLVIDLKKGRTKLTGDIVGQLVRFVPENGDLGRIELQRDLIQSMFVQMLTLENVSKAPSLFDKMLENAETNFTMEMFNNNVELIFSYASYSKIVVQYPGSMKTSGGETYFEPKLDEAISMFKSQK